MLREFLDQGEPAEADWAPHVLRLATRGELGDGGRGVLLDLPALGQPYGCTPASCTPGNRERKARSCCADLEVTPDPDERARLEAELPALTTFFAARDERWARGAPEVFDDDALRRPKRRCVFALPGPDGLRCGLQVHEAEGGAALKPLACQLFPLAVVELSEDQVLITAIHRRTAALLSSRPARVFPCLGVGTQTLAEAEQPALARLLGARRAGRVVREVRAWVADRDG